MHRYFDEDTEGVFKCVVCDEELFTSKQKFDSGSGWPSFFDAIQREKITYIRDYALGNAYDNGFNCF